MDEVNDAPLLTLTSGLAASLIFKSNILISNEFNGYKGNN